MKTGFCSSVAPGWDLETILTSASTLGFDGVELRGLGGDLNLPMVPELAADPRGVQGRFAEHNVALVSLAASATLDARKRSELAAQKAIIIEFVELAEKLKCPNVRIYAGEVQRRDHRHQALSRIADALSSLIPVLSRHGVTLLVENGGDFPDSEAMWFLADAVEHPTVRICWNQCHAMTALERPTTSIPRLGRKIGLVHIGDATYDEQGVLLSHQLPGQGDVGVARQIDLLRGVAYDGWLIFDWPKLWVETLPPPESTLQEVAKFLRARLDAKQSVLSAYKGDKRAPRMPSLPSTAVEGAAAG